MNELADIENASGIDQIEAAMLDHPKVEMPVTHRFTPGLYIREIFMPAGTMLTSAQHKTEHPFVISMGRIRVVSENEGSVIYVAPWTGITKPNTRRVLYAEEDTIWTTFHVTDETDVEKIGRDILELNPNKLLGEHPRLNQWRDQSPTIEKQ